MNMYLCRLKLFLWVVSFFNLVLVIKNEAFVYAYYLITSLYLICFKIVEKKIKKIIKFCSAFFNLINKIEICLADRLLDRDENFASSSNLSKRSSAPSRQKTYI